MTWHRRLGLLYAILVVLILAMGAWWTYYIHREGRTYERYQLQRLATDRLHAVFLLELDGRVASDPRAALGESYPHLRFERADGGGWTVSVDPEVTRAIRDEARRRNRMFQGEGIFFLALLIAGTTILTLAFRREREFKRARELFLAGATHELKTPLTCIRLYTETLERTDLDEADRRRIHGALTTDIERLEAMMEQILALSRDEDDLCRRPETLDLAEETEDLLASLGPFLEERGADVTRDLSAGRLVHGDRRALRVALRNLLHNAVVHGDGRVRLTLETREGRHRLGVSDEGPGVPRRERGRIFDSFYRGDAGTPGSGLGLHLAKRNAEALGGAIELESEEGRGATFTLVLPVREEERT